MIVVVECCCFLIKIIVGTPEPQTAHSAADVLRELTELTCPTYLVDGSFKHVSRTRKYITLTAAMALDREFVNILR